MWAISVAIILRLIEPDPVDSVGSECTVLLSGE